MIATLKDIYERYHPSLSLPNNANRSASIVFMTDADKLLIRESEGDLSLPGLNDFSEDLLITENIEYLGMLDENHCFCMSYDETIAVPEGMKFESLRALYDRMDEVLGLVASRAVHISGWSRRSRYCGVCGSSTRKDDLELARRCPSCGNVIYPRISPAIIIAVVKEDKLLLAHNRNFRQKWYSTLAGFIEPGETIEACAQREVFEEAGIRIKNIRYFGSQPWPFPDSLMIGLTAEYESGEVTPDGVEIDDAAFFGIDELPDTPGKYSVAGKLIDWFIQTHNTLF